MEARTNVSRHDSAGARVWRGRPLRIFVVEDDGPTRGVWLRNWYSRSSPDARVGWGEREVHGRVPAIGEGKRAKPQDVLSGMDLPA